MKAVTGAVSNTVVAVAGTVAAISGAATACVPPQQACQGGGGLLLLWRWCCRGCWRYAATVGWSLERTVAPLAPAAECVYGGTACSLRLLPKLGPLAGNWFVEWDRDMPPLCQTPTDMLCCLLFSTLVLRLAQFPQGQHRGMLVGEPHRQKNGLFMKL